MTLPNEMLVELRLKVGTDADKWRAKVFDTLPAVADRVAVCAEVTAETVAVNPALVAFAGTVTVAGTTTAELLLERATVTPPLAAGAVRLTVQASLPDPVRDALVQESALKLPATAAPVPLRLTTADGVVEEVLLMVSCPVAAPVAVGSN